MVDSVFAVLVDQLFADAIEERSKAYAKTRDFLKVNQDTLYVYQMFHKVRNSPFNIKGRSNVLSILSTADQSLLESSEDVIRREIRRIEDLGQRSPSYAVGPQTKGWISEIENRLSAN